MITLVLLSCSCFLYLPRIFCIGFVFIVGPVLTHLDLPAGLSLPEVVGDCILSLHLFSSCWPSLSGHLPFCCKSGAYLLAKQHEHSRVYAAVICLETLVLGFKNSRQHATTTTFIGLFAELKIGPFVISSYTPWPFQCSSFSHSQENWQVSLGGWPHSILQLWMSCWLRLDTEQSKGWCFSYPVYICRLFLLPKAETQLKLVCVKREIFGPWNWKAQRWTASDSESRCWHEVLRHLCLLLGSAVPSWFPFQEGFSPMGAWWLQYL